MADLLSPLAIEEKMQKFLVKQVLGATCNLSALLSEVARPSTQHYLLMLVL